jgi:signal transduction histidine kinase
VFDGERSSFEFTHDNRQYRTNLVPLRSPDGAVDAGLALVVDVTEQREYERELERQNQRLGEFASIVSHDLRNPLNVIEGRLQLYRETGDEEHLDAVEHSAERMGNLINDLLDLARQGQTVGDIERVDIAELVTRCCESVDTGDATIVTDDPGTVAADAARLGQLLTNLFRNSVEHGSTSPASQTRQDAVEHGSTSNQTESDDAVEHAGPAVTVRVGGLADGFYVEDDGPGIAPDRRDEVLEYGVTDSADGTGIGLAIVAEIAEAHGWTVTVTESDSGGARFEFTGVDRTEASPVQSD